MANLDIIVYALVAAILLVRLWSVFGRRNDEDRPQPNPFAAPAPGPGKDDAPFRLARGGNEVPASPLAAPVLAAPMSLMGALDQVKQFDAAFDEKAFLQKARADFTAIIAAFAKGDLGEVEGFLGPKVAAGFRSAIDARAKAGESLQSRLLRFRDAEVTAARVEDNRAFITVRFASEQENILKDAAGKVAHGQPGKSEEITDIWVFARDAKASDWQLVETRS